MSALEQEIVEKFRLLDKEARRRVLQLIEDEIDDQSLIFSVSEPMSADEWLKWAQAFGSYIHEKYGSLRVSSVELLDEAREERLNDLMGGR